MADSASAALINAGPSKELNITISESASEILPSVLPSNVPEMAAQIPGSLPTPQEHQEPFRLMDLPTEVRRMIFKELLVMNRSILLLRDMIVESKGQVEYVPRPRAFIHTEPEKFPPHRTIDEANMVIQRDFLNIFTANVALYRETAPVYFGLNTFYFQTLDLFDWFIGKIGAEKRWMLARVRISHIGNTLARAIKSLNSCLRLRELTLDLEPTSAAPTHKYNPAPAQLQLWGMKDLLKLRGLTKLKLTRPDYVYIGMSCITGTALKKLTKDLEARLQVLKQPVNPKTIKKQEMLDFPAKKMRTRFGLANVVTRYVLLNTEIVDMTTNSVIGTRAKR